MHYLEHERLPEWSIGPDDFAPLESRYCVCADMCSQQAADVDELHAPHAEPGKGMEAPHLLGHDAASPVPCALFRWACRDGT
jgi:hypothetical protein